MYPSQIETSINPTYPTYSSNIKGVNILKSASTQRCVFRNGYYATTYNEYRMSYPVSFPEGFLNYDLINSAQVRLVYNAGTDISTGFGGADFLKVLFDLELSMIVNTDDDTITSEYFPDTNIGWSGLKLGYVGTPASHPGYVPYGLDTPPKELTDTTWTGSGSFGFGTETKEFKELLMSRSTLILRAYSTVTFSPTWDFEFFGDITLELTINRA